MNGYEQTREFEKVACVGAGLIGSGWATLFSMRGLEVRLYDVNSSALLEANKAIKNNLSFLRNHGLLEDKPSQIMNRVKSFDNMTSSLENVDYVQESVPDNLELKIKVFEELGHKAPETALLASSSSGLLMSDIQKHILNPSRCVLVHPILPPFLIPVVEIAGGAQTSDETREKARDFMLTLGKIPVVLKKEVPGYIVNRIQAAVLREAISLITSGVASAEEVDTAFALGIGVRDPIFGPFLRAFVAGDGIESFIENYHQSYVNRWRNMENWTAIPSEYIDKIVEDVRNIRVINEKTYEEIKTARNEKLVQILKTLTPVHPFYETKTPT